MLHSYFTHTALTLYSYCTRTLLILHLQGMILFVFIGSGVECWCAVESRAVVGRSGVVVLESIHPITRVQLLMYLLLAKHVYLLLHCTTFCTWVGVVYSSILILSHPPHLSPHHYTHHHTPTQLSAPSARYTAISLGWGWGSHVTGAQTFARDNYITKNHITAIMAALNDGGCTYTLGTHMNAHMSRCA